MTIWFQPFTTELQIVKILGNSFQLAQIIKGRIVLRFSSFVQLHLGT